MTIERDDSCASITFSELCDVFQQVYDVGTTGGDKKLDVIQKFLEKHKLFPPIRAYPVLRLFLPHLDKKRIYDMKEVVIGRFYCEMFGLGRENSDAVLLLNWKNPDQNPYRSRYSKAPTTTATVPGGNFSTLLATVLEKHLPPLNPHAVAITVAQINDWLDALHHAQNPASRKELFERWSARLSAVEQKWLVRIILKHLKIGLHVSRFLDQIHLDANMLLNQTGDFEYVLQKCKDYDIRHPAEILPFQLMTPMLAKAVKIPKIHKEFPTLDFILEPKLDGERVLCHIVQGSPGGGVNDDDDGPRVEWITRNGKNYTTLYGPSLTSVVLSVIQPSLKSKTTLAPDCILDGEMMVWNAHDQVFAPFGNLRTVANAHRQAASSNAPCGRDSSDDNHACDSKPQKSIDVTQFWPCYVVWDVLYYKDNMEENDKTSGCMYDNIGGHPLRTRRKLLREILRNPVVHHIEMIEEEIVEMAASNDSCSLPTLTRRKHDIMMQGLDRALENGFEGLMLKDLTSAYACGEVSRKSRSWMKLKPDYAGLTYDIELVILGGYYGSGRRSGRNGNVGSFLVGLVTNDDIDHPTVTTFCKVGTGYNREELDQLRERLSPHWHDWPSSSTSGSISLSQRRASRAVPRQFGSWAPSKGCTPDVWIAPQHSVILELRGFEILRSHDMSLGLTLRFPRVSEIKWDKHFREASTVEHVQELFRTATESVHANKNKRKSASQVNPYAYDRHDWTTTTTTVVGLKKPKTTKSQSSGFLTDVRGSFCLVTKFGWKTSDKREMEARIRDAGGNVTSNVVEGKTTFVIPYFNTKKKIQKCSAMTVWMKHSKNNLPECNYDLINRTWLEECLDAQMFLPLHPRDYIFTTQNTQKRLRREFDQYGDSRTQAIEHTRTLEHIFSHVMSMSIQPSKEFSPWQTWLGEMEHSTDVSELKAVSAISHSSTMFLWHCVIEFDLDFVDIVHDQSLEDDRGFLQVQQLKFQREQAQLCGARIVKKPNRDQGDDVPTHYIVNEDEAGRRKSIWQNHLSTCRRTSGSGKQPIVISLEWLRACIRAQEQCDPFPFRVLENV